MIATHQNIGEWSINSSVFGGQNHHLSTKVGGGGFERSGRTEKRDRDIDASLRSA